MDEDGDYFPQLLVSPLSYPKNNIFTMVSSSPTSPRPNNHAHLFVPFSCHFSPPAFNMGPVRLKTAWAVSNRSNRSPPFINQPYRSLFLSSSYVRTDDHRCPVYFLRLYTYNREIHICAQTYTDTARIYTHTGHLHTPFPNSTRSSRAMPCMC